MQGIIHPTIIDVVKRDHEISKALAEFATFVIDKYDSEYAA